MHQIIIKVFLVALFSRLSLSQESNEIDDNIDIYWREYTGIVPRDAIPGGYDINNKTTYIGQGFVKNTGILVGMIYPGVSTLMVPLGGRSVPVTTYVKILCSRQKDSFRWIPTTIDNFHLVMINKYPVRGGYENFYTLNIGRIAIQGEVVVGKIVTASPDYQGKAPLFLVSTNKEHKVDSYESLIYVPEVAVAPRQVRLQRRR